MGGDKVIPYQRQQQGYNTGYSSFDPNVSDEAYLQRLGPSNSNLNQGAMKGWQDARASYNNRNEGGGFAFEMPDFSSMYQQTDYAEIQAQQQAEAERRSALSQISDLYSRKFDAAEKATADINQQIADEMGHAQVVGLDYSIDDATKQQPLKFAANNSNVAALQPAVFAPEHTAIGPANRSAVRRPDCAAVLPSLRSAV
jgi:hypothetical protein